MNTNEVQDTTVQTEVPAEPAGSPPAQPPMPLEPASVPPRRVRRVGTFTMGLVLVAAGAVITAFFFNPSMDILTVMKFSPLILVALGLEVLMSAFTAKKEKLKYDFLSMFVCFVLICASAGVAVCVPLMRYYGPEQQMRVEKMESEWNETLYNSLKDEPDVRGAYVNVSLSWSTLSGDADALAELSAADRIEADVTLDGSYDSAWEFVQACMPVTEAARSAAGAAQLRLYLSSEAEDGRDQYSLNLDSPYLLERPAQQLEKVVEVYHYNPDEGYYMSEEDYAHWQAEQQSFYSEQAEGPTGEGASESASVSDGDAPEPAGSEAQADGQAVSGSVQEPEA